jgi:hypothetical protein
LNCPLAKNEKKVVDKEKKVDVAVAEKAKCVETVNSPVKSTELKTDVVKTLKIGSINVFNSQVDKLKEIKVVVEKEKVEV